MIYCPDCGTENETDARFCKSCGRALSDVAAPAAAAVPAAGKVKPAPLADDGLPAGADLDGAPGGERVLWEGRPRVPLSWIAAITTRYKLTNERLITTTGFISKHIEEVELFRVEDVSMKQGVMERMFGLGDIWLETSDASRPEPHIKDVKDPERIKDMVRAAARTERQRRRVLLREEV